MDESGHLRSDSGREGMRPISRDQRVFRPLSYILLWWSSLVVIQLFILGQSMLPPAGGLNLMQASTVIVLSGLIVWMFFGLNADAGIRYGIPFAVHARSSFGLKGSRAAVLVRVVPAVFWYGIGSWIGASALNLVTNSLFGFGNIWVYFVGFQVAQTALAYYGIGSIRAFESVMGVVIVAILIFMMVTIIRQGQEELQVSWNNAGTWGLPFWSALAAAVGIFITAAINASDLSRFLSVKKQSHTWPVHMVALLPLWLFMIGLGILAAATVGVWNPVEALLQMAPSPALGIILLIFIAGAQFTTNLTINILPPAMAITEFTGIKWGAATIIVGVLAIVTMPWVLLTSQNFTAFINYYSAFLGPVLGVMLADHWIKRRRQLNIPSLYRDTSGKAHDAVPEYRWPGLAALAVGGVVGIIFVEISWIVALPVGMVAYLLFDKVQADRPSRDQVAEAETSGTATPAG